jgi:hypothetical protein
MFVEMPLDNRTVNISAALRRLLWLSQAARNVTADGTT